MLYALSWFGVFSLLVLWSLGAWLVHAVASFAAHAAAGAGAGSGVTAAWSLPAWVSAWLPAEAGAMLTAMASGLMPVLDAVLGLLPSLAGGLSVVIVVVWVLGSLTLIALGGLLHLLLRALRKRLPLANLTAQAPATAR
jgi:hypothetical protein